mgnify:FL=1
MIINKITVGFVIQCFDTDKQEWIAQTFMAGDEVSYELEDGTPINQQDFEDRVVGKNSYLPFEMKQPSEL